jgi:hypothetical protein
MIARFNLAYIAGLLLIIGSGLAALFLFLAPSLPEWGIRHSPHDEAKYLPLVPQQTVEQTFLAERPLLDSVAIWFHPTLPLPAEGTLNLTILTPDKESSSFLPIADISPDGLAIFQFSPAISVPIDQPSTLRLSTTSAHLFLTYQIDATKYPEGQLYYSPNPTKLGDLAWQVRYQRPALTISLVQWLYIIILPFAGLLSALLLIYLSRIPHAVNISLARTPDYASSRYPLYQSSPFLLAWRKWFAPLLLTLSVFLFYSFMLIRPGTWIGPSDFSKELSYVTASAEALRSFSWPVWSHYTCGGMSLLGNPEGTTLSLSTLLALITNRPEFSLWLTLAFESSVAGLGTFLLARALHLSMPASLLSATIISLSAVLPYKIVEGIVMMGGPVAFTPWVLLSLHRSIKSPSPTWLLLGGITLAAIFWRGDVHVIIGVLIVMLIWSIYHAQQQRRLVPLLALLVILLIAFLGASIKILPYLEQISLINAQVDPHSAQITQQNIWSDIFLQAHDRSHKIPVLHGLPEHFGYFGAYVGIMPLLLVLLSLFSRHPWRNLGWLLLFISLLLADGFVYEHFLRYLGPLSSLLRMPSRLLTISVLFIALLAGLGLDRLLQVTSRRQNIARARLTWLLICLIFLLFPAYDLSRVTSSILHQYLSQRSLTVLPPPDAPTLAAHLNSSPDNQKHASVLLQAGYLLPHLCGDQNNPPEFLSNITGVRTLTDFPTIISPNKITLYQVPAYSSISIRSRFVSSWQTSAGTLIAAPDQSIQLITPANSLPSIQLQYQAATVRSQQVLVLTFLSLAILLIIYQIYKIFPAVLH